MHCLFVILLLSLATNLAAQVHIISPVQNGIIQKKDSTGTFRLIADIPAGARFYFRLSDYTNNYIGRFDWKNVEPVHGRIDTIIAGVPIIKGGFILQWQTAIVEPEQGAVFGLQVGHLFAIGGQSNAMGITPPVRIDRRYDVRMLRDDSTWLPAHDPTVRDGFGSPWIAFANYFGDHLHDSLPIGIVNAAHYGAGLIVQTENGNWQRNDRDPFDPSTPYGYAVRQYERGGSNYEGFFWIQGESDPLYQPWEQADSSAIMTAIYQLAYQQLLAELSSDLKAPLASYHLQIGGRNTNLLRSQWGRIREAHRTLQNSILVGTAVGLPTADGLHYDSSTARVIGERFAGAVLRKQYGVITTSDLLLTADTPHLVTIDAKDSTKGYKIQFHLLRDGYPVNIVAPDGLQGFWIRRNTKMLDTSQIVVQFAPHDPTTIEITSRDSNFSLDDIYTLSYAITGNIDKETINDGDLTEGLPHTLTAFMDIPVVGTLSIREQGGMFDLRLLSNPVKQHRAQLLTVSDRERELTMTLSNTIGQVFDRKTVWLKNGSSVLSYDLPAASGIYFLHLTGGQIDRMIKVVE